MGNVIMWQHFDSKYFRLEKNERHRLVLSKWREEQKVFEGQSQNPVWTLVFDVLKIDNVELIPDIKTWSLYGNSASKFKKFIQDANVSNLEAFEVDVFKDEDNKLAVFPVLKY